MKTFDAQTAPSRKPHRISTTARSTPPEIATARALLVMLVIVGFPSLAFAQSVPRAQPARALAPPTTQSALTGQPPVPGTEPQLSLESSKLYVGLRGLVGIPVGEFADNVGTTGGLAGDFSYRVGESAVLVGATLGVLFQGRSTRRVPLSLTIPDVLVRVTTSTNMLMFHGRVRVQPPTGRVRPYADGLFGFNYLFTQTTVDLDQDFDFDPPRGPTTTNLGDFTPSAGVGGGILVGLAEWTNARFNLDLGAQYLYGGTARYFVGGSRGFALGVEGLELRRSRTDVVVVVVGGIVEF